MPHFFGKQLLLFFFLLFGFVKIWNFVARHGMRNEYAHNDDDYEHNSKEILSNEKKQEKSATSPRIEDNGDVNKNSSGSKGEDNRENSGIGIVTRQFIRR